MIHGFAVLFYLLRDERVIDDLCIKVEKHFVGLCKLQDDADLSDLYITSISCKINQGSFPIKSFDFEKSLSHQSENRILTSHYLSVQ